MNVELITWLIPVPPLLAFFIIFLATYKKNALSHTVAIAAAAVSWLLSMIIVFFAVSNPRQIKTGIISDIAWIPTGDTWFEIGVQVDALTAIMLFFVAWTILMIFIYSIGYHNYGSPKSSQDVPGLPPQGVEVVEEGHTHRIPSIEPMYARFFGYIGLFAFAMYLLVVSNNLLTLYIGWEIMGLCSYLLIGFWYGKPSARAACQKAFLTTRIGDVIMLIGLVSLYNFAGSLKYEVIFSNEVLQSLANTPSPIGGLSWAGFIGIFVFIGVIGKSAQFPLHIWLPDAMEGPTPVSAMIHAATMVSAGVYLAIRFFPVMSAGWDGTTALTPPMMWMAIIGSFTALFSATIAMAQNDVKRVLAYSTISQLGFMIAALGIGAYVAAGFHLLTHAIFKALLFLGSGSIIHGMEHGVYHTGEHIDPQNMVNMGGLYKKMPRTFITFLVGGFALAGFPIITAGFWSKDEILSGAFNGGFIVVFAVLAFSAFITAFYTMRQITLVFLGKPRTKAAEHALETPLTMTGPLMVLAFFAITIGWIGIPELFPGLGGIVPNWLEHFLGMMLPEHHAVAHHSSIPLITSLVVSLGGLFLGWVMYRKYNMETGDPLEWSFSGFFKTLKNKYYIDEIYQTVFIKPAHWLSEIVVYKFLDQKVFDGFIHGLAKACMWLGNKLRFWFDLPVINTGGDKIAEGSRKIGTSMKVIQSGKVQDYMVLALTFSIIGGLIFYLIFLRY